MKYFIKNRETGFLFLFFAPDFLDSIILTKNKKILNISGKEGEKIMANTIKKAIQEGLEVKYVTKSTVLGEGWGVVITTKDGEEFSPFYPFGTFEGVREFTRSNLDLLLDKMSSDDNHGLAIKNAVKTAKKEGTLYENIKHFFKK